MDANENQEGLSSEERDFWRQREVFKHQDIHAYKQQQWVATNYALLLLGALIALVGENPEPPLPELAAWLLPLAVGVVAVIAVWSLEAGLHSARKETSTAYNELKPGTVKTKARAGRKPWVAVFLNVVVAGAAWLTSWVMLDSSTWRAALAFGGTVTAVAIAFGVVRPDKH